MTYGVVSKGNGEAWIMPEKHTALSVGGGQAGQGYPCVLAVIEVTAADHRTEVLASQPKRK